MRKLSDTFAKAMENKDYYEAIIDGEEGDIIDPVLGVRIDDEGIAIYNGFSEYEYSRKDVKEILIRKVERKDE